MNLLVILETASNTEGNDSTIEKIKRFITSPTFFIVVGSVVLFIVLIYLLTRFIKAKPNATTIVVRRGKIQKVLDENNKKYFLVPFVDSVGAVIKNSEKEFSSDQLFINNGPDHLYKINYTLKYHVADPVEFYPHIEKLNDEMPIRINDELRLFADEGNALKIIKDYRDNNDVLLNVINNAVKEYSIEVTYFKINIIEPIG